MRYYKEMDSGHEYGSVVLETPDEIYTAFRAVDLMELDLTETVTAADRERLKEILDSTLDRMELTVADSRIALIGLELAASDSRPRDAKVSWGASSMLQDYQRKRHTLSN